MRRVRVNDREIGPSMLWGGKMPNSIDCFHQSKSFSVGVSSIDRRRLLTAVPAVFAMATLGGVVRGLAASAPHAFRHGAFEITIVSDGYFVLPPPNVATDVGFLYPDTPRDRRWRRS